MKKLNYKILLLSLIGFLISAGILFASNKGEVYTVNLSEEGFSPETLEIRKGDTVRFTSDKMFWPASDPHPIHDTFPSFDSKKPVNPGETYSFKFNKPGEWKYHDHLFPAYRGVVIVEVSKTKKLSRADITKIIDTKGPEKGYFEIKQSLNNLNQDVAHTAMHLTGEELFKKIGTGGVTICDESYGFGCYHGLFIKAVSSEGTGIIAELDKKCTEKFGPKGLGCPHGIGHGIGEFYNHSKLDEQLKLCEGLSWKGDYFGCKGGVFMENNFRTEFSEAGTKINLREAGEDLHLPCRDVKKEYKKACYYDQASWWREIFNKDTRRVGSLCAEATDSSQEACFIGLGANIAESSGYSDSYIGECALMPSKEAEAFCRAGVSWAFFANPEKRTSSEMACSGLVSFEQLCLTKRLLVE